MSTDKNTSKMYSGSAEAWSDWIAQGAPQHKYLEKPAMFGKLGDVTGKSVLCLGCGTGEEAAYIISKRPKNVVGVDIAEGLIKLAEKNVTGVDFHTMDMEKLTFANNTFDIVYSSLVMHYIKDWLPTLSQVKRVLKPGGRFLFSTHHPVKWGANTERHGHALKAVLGFNRPESNQERCEVYGDYLNLVKITDTIGDGQFPITYYNRPISMMLTDFRRVGFEMVDMMEPKATDQSKTENPNFWRIHQHIPQFVIFELQKPFT